MDKFGFDEVMGTAEQVDKGRFDEVQLKDICIGITDGSHNPPQGIEYSEFIMLSSKNVYDNKLTFDEPRYLTEDDFESEDNRTRVREGDVLLTIVGTVGRTAVVTSEMPQFTLQRSVAVLHPDLDKCDSRYLMYALQSRRNEIDKKSKGVAQKGIYLKEVSQLRIPIVEINKQRSVVYNLDKINNVISKRRTQIEELDTLIKARFVEMFGDPITNTKNFETSDLKDTLALKAGDFTAASDIVDKPNETNKYPCYGGNGIRGYVAEYNQSGEYSLIGRQGALSGNVQYAKGQFKNTEHALLVTPMVEMNSIWLNQLLINLDLKRYQTGAAQPGLSVKNLQEIQIIMVPMNMQNQFADFVTQIDKSKVAVQKSLDELQILFDSLMQEYFG